MKYSHQRITKIKKDYIEELLKKAEGTDVKNACSIQQPGSDLTPYPDLDNLRLWSRDYLLKGINKIFPVKFDSDGQTHLTTVVDGLVLFTKLTKSIGYSDIPKVEETDYVQPTDFVDVSAIDTTRNCVIATYLNSNSYFYYCLNTWNTTDGHTWHSSNGKNQTVIIHFKDLIKPTSINFENRRDDPNNPQVISQVTVYASNNNIDYVQIGFTTNNNQSVGGAWSVDCNTDIFYNFIKLEFVAYGDYCALSKCKFNGRSGKFLGYSTLETSKPGLWLSNLVQPVSDSLAGSWLRHNLIHDNLSLYTSLNADTIGNYTFSFYQRGIIHRDKGSTHDNNDSYCQHWSPSALGCISHDAIIIPENNLRSTYTSYQMPVTPVNPDMQSYEETMSKDVAFTFVDNTNDIPLITTTFNGRVVGDGWTYEFLFRPNGNGSGNDYGNGSNPSADNGSNGGCVTGTIVYADSSLDTTCTQEVNSCFVTDQSIFNPLVPEVPSGTQTLSNDPNSFTIKRKCNVPYGTTLPGGSCIGGPCISSCKDSDVNFGRTDGRAYITSGSVCTYGGYNDCTVVTYEVTPANARITDAINLKAGGWSAETWKIGDTSSSTYLLGTGNPNGAKILYGTVGSKPQTGINLYLNITDLKKQYEGEGIPWSGGCGIHRFEIDISTTKCEEKYCTAILIAKNVDINSLGDISKLEEQVWSNSK